MSTAIKPNPKISIETANSIKSEIVARLESQQEWKTAVEYITKIIDDHCTQLLPIEKPSKDIMKLIYWKLGQPDKDPLQDRLTRISGPDTDRKYQLLDQNQHATDWIGEHLAVTVDYDLHYNLRESDVPKEHLGALRIFRGLANDQSWAFVRYALLADLEIPELLEYA